MEINNKTKEELIKELEALQASAEQFQLLFNKAPLGYQSLDFDGNFIEVNQQWLDTLGYQREEVIGKWFGDFLTPPFRDGFRKRFPIFKAQGHIHSEFEMIHKNGSILFIAFEGKIGYDLKGEFKQTHCILQDITEKKRAEIALEESELTFRKLFEESSDAILLINENGVFVECNQAALDLLKIKREQFLFLSPDDISPEFQPNGQKSKDSAKAMIDFAYKKGLHRFDWTHNDAEGEEFIVDVSLMPIILKGKQMLHATWRNITDRKKAEEALLKQNFALSELNKISLKLSKLQSDENIEEFITKQIKIISGAEVAIYNEYNAIDKTTSVLHIEMKSGLLEKIVGLLGKQLKKTQSPISDEMYKEMISERLKFKMTLHQATNGSIPPTVATAIQKVLKADRFIGLAYILDEKLYGTTLLAMGKDKPDPPKEILENFISLAAISLERKKAEEALKESENVYRNMIENSPLGMHFYKLDNNNQLIFTGANPASDKLLGVDNSKFIGKTIEEAFPLLVETEVPERYRLAASNGIPWSIEQIAYNDRLISGAFEVKAFQTTPENMVAVFTDITERKQAEEAVRKSEENLSITLNSIGDGVISTDIKGLIVNMNPIAEKLCGWKLNEALSKPLTDIFKIINAETREAVADPVQKVLENGEIVGLANHTVLISKDGSEYQISDSAAPIKSKDGKITGVVLVFSDVTERYESEVALRESEARYKALHNASFGGIVIHDKGKILECNHGLSEITGYSYKELIGMDGLLLIAPETRDLVLNNILSGFEKPYEAIGIRKNGELYPLRLEARNIPFKGKRVRTVEFRDVTEQKQAEEALHYSQERFRIAQEMSPDGFTILRPVRDSNGQVIDFTWIYQNPAVAKMNGTDPEKVVGKRLLELFPGHRDTQLLKTYLQVAESGESCVFEADYSGETMSKPMSFRIVVVPMKEDIAILAQDITERKQAEEALRKSEQKMRSIYSIAPAGIGVVKNRVLIDVNPLVCQMTGYTKDELVDKNSIILYPSQEEYDFVGNEKYRQIMETGTGSVETLWKKKDGTIFNILLSSTPIDINDLSKGTIFTALDITERKQAEEALKESESKLSTIFKNNPTGLIIVHEKSKIIYDVNDFALKIFGSKKEDIIGKVCHKFLCPAENGNCPICDLGQDLDRSERILLKPDGTKVPILKTVVRITLKGEKYLLESFIDITERKQTEEDLKNRENLLNKIFDVLPIGLWFSDKNGRLIRGNPAGIKIWGAEPTVSIEDYGIFKARRLPSMIEIEAEDWALAHTISKGVTIVDELLEIDTFDGQKKIILNYTAPVIDDYGKTQGAIVVNYDITERKQAELLIEKKTEEIEFHNKRLESLLKISQYQTQSIQELLDFALQEAIILTKSKIGYIYFYNETTEQFVLNTWSKEVMSECKVMDPQTIYDLDKTGCWGEAVRQRKPIVINDYQAENPLKKGIPHGHVKLQKFLTIPVIYDNKIVAVAGVANKENDYDNSDIMQLTLLMDSVWKSTERILLIEDLTISKEKAEESDRLKSAFLANMSHEIRTPMNGILGFAGLLKKPNLSGTEQQKYISIIEKSGTRMLNIINDIVDISKIEAGLMKLEMHESNINEKIEYIFTFFKPEVEAKGIKLSFNTPLPAKDVTITTDNEKLYAILTNLVKNAIKYTKKGSIEFGYVKKDDFLEFYVKDTGIGIPNDRQEAIFERFIQADIADKMAHQGAGLGLSITKAYVEMLGGKIWVESEEGVGSTFYFTLPYNNGITNKTVYQQLATPDKNKQIKKLKILLAEDDEISEMLIEIILNSFGKEIIKARTGYDTVEECKKNPDLDLILMDIQMPEINGYNATRQIREFNKDVVIIAQTAYGLSGDREKAIEAGCNDYIAKPINKDELIALINKYFIK